MTEIIFATKNKHKVQEINQILKGTDLKVITMEEAGLDIDVVEDGKTFEANAIKKAVEIMEATGALVLADDSGLEVDYLDGKPGIYSARYGGRETPYKVKNQMIIDALADARQEERSARFVCVVAAASPGKEPFTCRGTVEGLIAYEEKGQNGFGYDPIFYVPKYNMTTAEMDQDLKNKISHRGKALRSMKEALLDRHV